MNLLMALCVVPSIALGTASQAPNEIIAKEETAASFETEEVLNYEHLEEASFADDYAEEKRLEEKNEPVIFRASGSPYSDNGHNDNRYTGANKIGDSGTIRATLNTNNGWTQFWNNVGEIDEDWYRFSIENKLNYTFSFSAPYGYKIQLYRYTSGALLLRTASSSFQTELDPATYYIRVYAENKSDVTSQQYTVTFSGTRISNTSSVSLNSSYMSTYKMAIWENEKKPFNANRWNATTKLRTYTKPRRGDAATSGYIDPIFLSSESNTQPTAKSEKYLDSIIYVWGKQELQTLSQKIYEVNDKVKEAIKQKKIEEIKAEYRQEGGSFFVELLGYIPGAGQPISITSTTISGGITLAHFIQMWSGSITVDTKEYDLGFAMGRLAEACYQTSLRENGILCLPRYAYIKKENGVIGNSTLKTYKWTWTYSYFEYGMDDPSHFAYTKSYISPLQTLNETGITYRGKITGFTSGEAYRSYTGK